MSYLQKYWTPKGNKYNAKGRTYNGHYYDSTYERDYAINLDWRKKAGEIKEWFPHVKIDLRINDKHITNYFVDFKIINLDGSVEYHETKGFETDLWRLKWNIFHALKDEIDPGCEIVLIKQSRFGKYTKKVRA